MEQEKIFLKQFTNEIWDKILEDYFKSSTLKYFFAMNKENMENNISIVTYGIHKINLIDVDKNLLENNASIKILQKTIKDINSSILIKAKQNKLKFFASAYLKDNNHFNEIINNYRKETNINNIFEKMNEDSKYLIDLKNQNNRDIDIAKKTLLKLHENYLNKMSELYSNTNINKDVREKKEHELEKKYSQLSNKIQKAVDSLHKCFKDKIENHRDNTLSVIRLLLQNMSEEYLKKIQKDKILYVNKIKE